jgi:CheY-specific phosphatase CheX
MESNLNKALHQSAARIFEEICFMFEAPEMEEEQREQKAQVAISVDFRGPIEGTLVMSVSDGLLASIAENMLGEEVPSAAQSRDAIGEVANVICGNVLPAIAGPKEVFSVDAPQIREVTGIHDNREKPTAETQITLDQGWARLMLHIRSKAACSECTMQRQAEKPK